MNRRGFSLLEMILAIGLIVMLFAGVFVFYQYSISARAATQQSAEEVQLARSALEQMGGDLKSISAVPAMMQQLVVARGGIKGAQPNTAGGGGLVGQYNIVSFQADRCVPIGRMMAPVQMTAGQSSAAPLNRPPLYDLLDVQWYWSYDETSNTSYGLWRTHRPSVTPAPLAADAGGQSGGAGSPPPANNSGGPSSGGNSADGGSPAIASDTVGDTGLPAPVPGAQIGAAADQPVDAADEPPPDPLLVSECVSPEVQWMYVRYYDGSTWSDSFDGAGGKLPLAVEITIGFEPLLTADECAGGTTVADKFAKLFGDGTTDPPPLPARSYQTTVYLASGDAVTKKVRVQQ